MRDIPVSDDLEQLRDYYRHFGEAEAAPVSVLYEQWALALAEDEEMLERVMELPAEKRQAILLFAAARVHGVPMEDWSGARQVMLRHWPEISATMRRRRIQTNEPGRIATLNLALSRIQDETRRPLALIEVGASAGLCLYPDAWPIRYIRGEGDDVVLFPEGGVLRSSAELRCELAGLAVPSELPQVAWRAGIDLNPLDLRIPADREWLEAMIWPGMEYRLERVHAGAELVDAEPPSLFAGDLNEQLPKVLAQVPEGATPVVFHSAVLVYLSGVDRGRFLRQVRRPGVRWVSNEGPGIFPEIAAQLSEVDEEKPGFILSLDGTPIARTGHHGQYVSALSA